MTMNWRRWAVICAAILMLAPTGVRAATSDVADAAMRGDSAAIRRLLTQKVDVNAPQADGATALHWAAYHDDLATVDVLIRAGANGKLQGDRHLAYPTMKVPTGNLLLSLLDRFDIHMDSIGDSTGRLEDL